MSWKSKFEHWLTYQELDKELKEQLQESSDDVTLLEDQFYCHLEFGTAGMRGVIGPGTNRMNIYSVRRAAEGLARYMDEVGTEAKNRGIVIAYDSRHMSREFALEVAKTVGYHGIKAYVFKEMSPTPELSFAIRYLNAFAGVVITASHNPAEYNGFKLYGKDGGQITPHAAKRILEFIDLIENELAIPVAREPELLEQGFLSFIGEDVDHAYLEHVKSIKMCDEIDKNISIVYTPLHGTGNKLVQAGLRTLGYENITIVKEQELPDPNFSTVKSPNPEEHAAFELAMEYGLRVEADVLLATDPDADRIGIAVLNQEGKYEVLSGNQIGALIMHYILMQQQQKGILPSNGIFIKSIVTNDMGTTIAEDFGVKMINTLTGFKYISEKIAEYEKTNEYSYLFGYEESYGYLHGTFVRDKDAVQTALLLAEIAGFYKKQGTSIYQAMEQLYGKYGFFKEKVQSMTFKGKAGVEEMKKIMNAFRNDPNLYSDYYQIEVVEDYQTSKRKDLRKAEESMLVIPRSNVLKYFCKDGSWFCIRPSGTEPKMKIYMGVNGQSHQNSQMKLQRLEDAIMRKMDQLLAIDSQK